MKKLLMFLMIVIPVTMLSAQQQTQKENRNFRIPLIGEKAPSFTAEATTGTVNFPADFGRNWKVLFSHPQDFTPVCSSEILELANLQSEFDKLGVKLVVLSADPLGTHNDWKKALETLNYKGRTPVKIKFPLVDDQNLVVSKMYGMIHAPSNTTRDVRGVFIIDPDNTIQAIYFYPNKVGRSTDELIRTITALQLVAKDNVLTPGDWKAGNDVLIPYLPKAGDDKKVSTTNTGDIYNIAWFMTFKKLHN
ncbi:MAG: redoxin domain-containing protein [Bacteroidota bacterium]|nr:redoxin domain-containing protein [Bacteroidota bacterium]